MNSLIEGTQVQKCKRRAKNFGRCCRRCKSTINRTLCPRKKLFNKRELKQGLDELQNNYT